MCKRLRRASLSWICWLLAHRRSVQWPALSLKIWLLVESHCLYHVVKMWRVVQVGQDRSWCIDRLQPFLAKGRQNHRLRVSRLHACLLVTWSVGIVAEAVVRVGCRVVGRLELVFMFLHAQVKTMATS